MSRTALCWSASPGVVSTNEVGDGVAKACGACVRWRGLRRRQICRVSPSRRCWRRDFPDLDAARPQGFHRRRSSNCRACEAEAAGSRSKGVTKSAARRPSARNWAAGCWLLTFPLGFHVLLLALEPGHLDHRDIGRRYRQWSATTDFTSVGRRSIWHAGHGRPHMRERTVARAIANVLDRQGSCRGAPPGFSGIACCGHLVGAVNGRFVRSRRKTKLSSRIVSASSCLQNIRNHRRFRCGCSDWRSPIVRLPRASKVRSSAIIMGVLTTWLAGSRDRARTRTGHDVPAHRGVSSSPVAGSYNPASRSGATRPAAELIIRHQTGIYVTADRAFRASMASPSYYNRGSSALWIENGEITYARERR